MHRHRVAIIGVLQETNTFLSGATEWGDFERGILLYREEIIEQYGAGNHEISGFLAGLASEGIEAVPVVFAFALPGPKVSTEALSHIEHAIIDGLREAGRLDGVLVAAGGAAVCEAEEDLEGWLLSLVRRVIGPHAPLIATLDPHCHLSAAMLTQADALLAYRTNPHLDQTERGHKAAVLMARTLRGEVIPRQRYCRLPFVINIEKQSTTLPPLSDFLRAAAKAESYPGILDISLILGFPYGDVPEMGTGILVVSDGTTPDANRSANHRADTIALHLGEMLWAHRPLLHGEALSPEAAVARALHSPAPVLLLDMGDNIGGGACGDSTWLAHLLMAHPHLRSFVCIHDPQAVAQCRRSASQGSLTLPLAVGGWSTPALQGAPLRLEARVDHFPPTHFREEQPRHGGWLDFQLGECVLVSHTGSGLKVLITSRAVPPFSSGLLTVAGLRMEDFDIITAKGVHGPIGAFGPECRTIIWSNTPGITTADLSQFHYRKRQRPMEPFEPIPALDIRTCIEHPQPRHP